MLSTNDAGEESEGKNVCTVSKGDEAQCKKGDSIPVPSANLTLKLRIVSMHIVSMHMCIAHQAVVHS